VKSIKVFYSYRVDKWEIINWCDIQFINFNKHEHLQQLTSNVMFCFRIFCTSQLAKLQSFVVKISGIFLNIHLLFTLVKSRHLFVLISSNSYITVDTGMNEQLIITVFITLFAFFDYPNITKFCSNSSLTEE